MWTQPSDPQQKTLVLLGEAPGAEEEETGKPFVGASGRLLTALLANAGLDRTQWHLTNVFQLRPPENKLDVHWTRNRTELKKLGLTPNGAPLQKRFLLPEYWAQVEQTRALLASLRPDLIVGLGAKAQWFLSGDDRIGTFRGTFFPTAFGCPALTTFHPAAVLREYKMLPVVLMDLIKVRQHLAGTLPAPLRRSIYINPTWQEMELVYQTFRSSRKPLGVDIETSPSIDQITCISFATPTLGICLPLWDKDAAAGTNPSVYNPSDETRLWRMIDRFAQLPNDKILQNGLYDMQYLLDAPIPIRLAGKIEDTAIMQHAYQPELRKDLGSLASFNLNEPAWKQMRTSAKDAKADD